MREYIIRGGVEGRRRLALLTSAMRPFTTALLDAASIPAGARVLDAGCGGGDVTLELARRVGARGKAVGLDLDPIEIDIARKEATAVNATNVEYRVANLMTDGIEGRFDVVYARFFLSHLAAPREGLERLLACLDPGGTIIVEDVDFRGHFCHPPRASFMRYVALYEESARRRGVDPHIGVRLPGLLAEVGAKSVQAQAVNPAAVSGPIKQMAAATLSAIAETLVNDGIANREQLVADIEDLSAAIDDPGCFMSMPRVVQCWAKAG